MYNKRKFILSVRISVENSDKIWRWVMDLTKEEKDRSADEYFARIDAITKENVLREMRLMMVLHCTKGGKFVSSKANEYRDMLAEYAIYCKEEDFLRWQDMCQYLIDSIPRMVDEEWLYEAWTVEATARLMKAMDGEFDWNSIEEIVHEQGHTGGTISEVAQLLIAYSPNGLSFVDHIAKPSATYSGMKCLNNAYNTEVNRRMRCERREKKQLGARLVKCLNTHLLELNKNN